MTEERYRIRMKRGHHKKLRFWFCPVNEKIMNADADWLEDAELSCEHRATRQLFYPFIKKYFPGEFLWKNELNLMPFENVRAMTKEVRKVVKLMRRNYADPRLARYKKFFSIDVLVDTETFEEKYIDQPDYVRDQAVLSRYGDFCASLIGSSAFTVQDFEKQLHHSAAG